MIINFRRFALVSLLSIVSACKTLPETEPDKGVLWLSDAAPFNQRQQRYEQRNQWRYTAKVGLVAPTLRESANIIWEYADRTNNVRLFGPLGAGAVRLKFNRYGAELLDNKGVAHRGDNAEALLTEIVGWPIPIDALSRWLFVLPTVSSAFRYKLDDQGNVVVLEQLGWHIEYSAYKTYGEHALPRKIVATKQLAKNQSLVVKLITKTWQ